MGHAGCGVAGADLTQKPSVLFPAMDCAKDTADPGEWEWRNYPLEKQFLDPFSGGRSSDVK